MEEAATVTALGVAAQCGVKKAQCSEAVLEAVLGWQAKREVEGQGKGVN